MADTPDYFAQFGASEPDARRITASAWELWFSFQDLQQTPFFVGPARVADPVELSRNLLRPPAIPGVDPSEISRWPHNRTARDFFVFCAELRHETRDAILLHANLDNAAAGIQGHAIS